MRTQDFAYDLPPDRIAQTPVEPRDTSRLLVVRRGEPGWEDAAFRDLPSRLGAGDLVVVNDTRVVPARLWGHKESGGRVEVLLLTREAPDRWEALVRAAKRSRPETWIHLGDGVRLQVMEVRGEGRYLVRVEAPGDPLEVVEALGEMPLPPYIQRSSPDVRDRRWYQTLFAHPEKGGSAAAPTAGLHFTSQVLADLEARGVETAAVTLHVGLGTFLPVRTESLAEHTMHREWYQVPEPTAAAVNRALDEGRRVVAVGTTVTRVLEHGGAGGRVEPGSGWTDLFLSPGHRFRMVGGLLT
ncbi:MAG: tRNA preQ1(34) S-adenosylmethionine ribosyltransferase-isomerase QueA, partial [Proteobacteria bacterium]|nr:tRNA preQ1(34) S-adenosylmethionine ribosyltransferase-isomerase QueA [Pseudomonadota bacterium]